MQKEDIIVHTNAQGVTPLYFSGNTCEHKVFLGERGYSIGEGNYCGPYYFLIF